MNTTMIGHAARAFARSFDGRLLAVAGRGGIMRVWGPAGHLVTTDTGHAGINALAFSPDGATIASGGEDDCACLWRLPSGEPLGVYSGHGSPVTALAWSPDGGWLASAEYSGRVDVWDQAAGSRLFSFEGGGSPVTALAWSPDGAAIASAGDVGVVQVWRASTGRLCLTCQGRAHLAEVRGLAWSPDGAAIASLSTGGSGEGAAVQVWDASTGELVASPRRHAGGEEEWVFDLVTRLGWMADPGQGPLGREQWPDSVR